MDADTLYFSRKRSAVFCLIKRAAEKNTLVAKRHLLTLPFLGHSSKRFINVSYKISRFLPSISCLQFYVFFTLMRNHVLQKLIYVLSIFKKSYIWFTVVKMSFNQKRNLKVLTIQLKNLKLLNYELYLLSDTLRYSFKQPIKNYLKYGLRFAVYNIM